MEPTLSKIHLGRSIKGKVSRTQRLSGAYLKSNHMNRKKSILRHTLQLLSRDVQSFRQIILASEGGELPKEIKEKEKLMHAIERLIKSSPHQHQAHS
jgi:hypothetical protein